jgi:hypothetical protein
MLAGITETPPWLSQMQFINSDVFKLASIGQPDLALLSGVLAKNLDFGFEKTAARFAEQFVAQQNSW